VHAGRQKLKLDEETRWQVAGEAIDVGRYGGWKARSHPNEANDKRECRKQQAEAGIIQPKKSPACRDGCERGGWQ